MRGCGAISWRSNPCPASIVLSPDAQTNAGPRGWPGPTYLPTRQRRCSWREGPPRGMSHGAPFRWTQACASITRGSILGGHRWNASPRNRAPRYLHAEPESKAGLSSESGASVAPRPPPRGAGSGVQVVRLGPAQSPLSIVDMLSKVTSCSSIGRQHVP